MKKCIVLIILFFTIFHMHTTKSLTHKEALFISTHSVTPEEQQIIDELLSNLDSALLDLLDGKSAVVKDETYKKLFEHAEFTVHNIRAHQCEEPGSDGYPARVILTHKKLPGYFIKIGFDRYSPQKNISRIMCTELINSLIDKTELNLTTIKKNHKKICPRPGVTNDDLIDMNYIVLSPKQQGKPGSENVTNIVKDGKTEPAFHFDTQKQYTDCMLLKETLDMRDLSPDNVIFTDDGKVVFIDTEILQDWIIDGFIEQCIKIIKV